MKNILKLSLVALGFCMSIVATPPSIFAIQVTGGRCEGDENHTCKVTSGGTTVYGYWVEAQK